MCIARVYIYAYRCIRRKMRAAATAQLSLSLYYMHAAHRVLVRARYTTYSRAMYYVPLYDVLVHSTCRTHANHARKPTCARVACVAFAQLEPSGYAVCDICIYNYTHCTRYEYVYIYYIIYIYVYIYRHKYIIFVLCVKSCYSVTTQYTQRVLVCDAPAHYPPAT